MRSTRRLNHKLASLCLILAMGIAPALTVCAQQTAQKKQAAPTAKPAADTKQVKGEKLSAEEDVPLSDAEMEKVEGGNPFAIGIGLAALAFAGYSYYKSNRAHQQLLRACGTSRR